MPKSRPSKTPGSRCPAPGAHTVFSVFLTSVILNLASLELDNAIVYFLFTAEACTLYVLLTYCLSILSTTQLFCSGLIFNVAAILVSVDFLAFVIIFLIAYIIFLLEKTFNLKIRNNYLLKNSTVIIIRYWGAIISIIAICASIIFIIFCSIK